MKVIDIALKDLLRSFRSLFAVGMMLVAPLLITGLIYFAFGGMGGEQPDMPAIQMGWVNQDTPPDDAAFDLGQMLVDMFTDESVEDWLTARSYPDEAAARAAVDRRDIGVAVLIPPNLTANILNSEATERDPILIVHDPTLTIGPQVAQDMVASMLDGFTGGSIAIQVLMDRQQAHGIAPDPAQIPELVAQYGDWYAEFQRKLFHEPEEAALRLVAPAANAQATTPVQQILGMIMAGQMIFFAFYTGAYSMMSILQEQEEGSLARLFTTPTNRTHILAGKFAAVFLTVIIQGSVLMLATHFIFDIDWGRPASVALALVGQVLAASGLGVFLISLVKTTRQAGPILGGGLTAFGMFGGLFTAAIPSMPAIFDTFSLFTPHGWVLKSWELAMTGRPPSDMLIPFAITVIMGSVMFAIGAVLFRRRFA